MGSSKCRTIGSFSSLDGSRLRGRNNKWIDLVCVDARSRYQTWCRIDDAGHAPRLGQETNFNPKSTNPTTATNKPLTMPFLPPPLRRRSTKGIIAFLLLWMIVLLNNEGCCCFCQGLLLSSSTSSSVGGGALYQYRNCRTMRIAAVTKRRRRRPPLSSSPRRIITTRVASGGSSNEFSQDELNALPPINGIAWSPTSSTQKEKETTNNNNNKIMLLLRGTMVAVPLVTKLMVVLTIKFLMDLIVYPVLWTYRLLQLLHKRLVRPGGSKKNTPPPPKRES
jgi:hypothetical protein